MGHFTRFDPNSYDLNKSSKKGVLIIHGFSSSTYETLPLGKFLSDKGFRVFIPNLPGHGTTVEDCNSFAYNVSNPDWWKPRATPPQPAKRSTNVLDGFSTGPGM